MTMFTYVLIGLVVLVVIVFIAAAMRPDTFRYTRSVTINAPASAIHPHVNDFHKWAAWSPWEKLDPNTQRTYGGAPSGVGATYAWQGNKNVGKGNMSITESHPDLIRIRLEFIKPFPAVNTTDFTFKEENGTTVLTQSMYGKNLFMGKVMSLFMSMDTMIGTQFEKGLADIKALVEASR